MNTIDYVYRFDPHNPSTKPPPTDAEAELTARQVPGAYFLHRAAAYRKGHRELTRAATCQRARLISPPGK